MTDSNIYPNQGQSIHPFLAGVLGNLALAVLKLSFALFGGSRLVFMDGLFSLMSAATFLLPWQAQILEKKAADVRYPYGLGKILFISVTVVGFLGLVIAIHMFYYSLKIMAGLRMYGFYTGMVSVTIISIVANEALYRYLMDQSKKFSKHLYALSARYNRIDVWISSFVLFLLILAGTTAAYLEKAGVVIISVVVFFVGLKMVFIGFGGIMDKVPPQKVLDRIRSCAYKEKAVKDVLNIKARYVGTLLHIDMSIAVDENIPMKNAHAIAQNVKRQLIEEIVAASDVNVIIA